MNFKSTFFTLLAVTAAVVNGERHVVRFDNRCGFGTPTLIQGPNVLSTGKEYVSNGPLVSAIAYLQTGKCGFNGDGCILVETTLKNPVKPGGGSSTDLSLIPPLAFSVKSGFAYYNGCDGAGAVCKDAHCPTAFHKPEDNQVQVACQQNDVNLVITFCV